mgnify:CR=1 FL=1
MKRNILNIEDIKLKILSLKGEEVEMKYNRGRKKFDTISGTIKDVYPSVFTVSVNGQSQVQTFSYYDVLCGNVIIL